MRRALFLVTLLLAMSIPIVEADSEEGVVFSWYGNATSVELKGEWDWDNNCLLYTSPSPRDATLSRMPSSA